ncbi:arabinosyltransferase domain-containing protein [Saccharopolyspora sp. 6V]|uniref:arabinosyltransferase domain-containing protein n=1 Tax=Saccharopolyspora sp. 6V TaxID=2877239 RepID=UPI001CD4F830|nr:arabinosyltransferase domain-containing protein [Saccharopolyspora sp. 6V]MCA1193829.1 arabinosyltransferase domain-containing protein [Saccharopolyspora sp. 6V]
MEPSSPIRAPGEARRPLDELTAPAARRARWIAHVVALLLGLAGLCCALALPFAPVWADRTEVSWPAADEPAVSTTALFAPYRPAEFTATVPCRALRAALDRPEPVLLLATTPPGSERDGLVLRTEDGAPDLVLGERAVPLPPLPADCDLTVRADAQRTEVVVGGLPAIVLPDVPAPEIFAFRTGLAPEQAAELSVTARAHTWFETAPSSLKLSLIGAALLLAASSLLLLVAHTPPTWAAIRRAVLDRIRFNTAALLLVDAAVAAVLACWLVIGPISDDDGFAMLTIRNHAATGDIGNFYRWFNASEAPFTLVQHLMRWVSEHSLAPAWLRVPSVVAGMLTWLVLAHGIVAPLCRGVRRVPVHLLSAVFFLACWLPFDLGIRPEAFVALGTAAVVALLLRATAPTARAPFGPLGAAALLTGLTVAVTPTGVAALLIVLAFAPRIRRVLVVQGALPRWITVPTRTALLCCLGSVGVVAMFADSTWTGFRRATEIHEEFGPSLGWYQEIDRYAELLGTTTWGTASKRLAVLLAIAAVLLASAAVLRRLHRAVRMPELPLLVGAVVAVFATLWLTPSKWTHHFGALAGVAPALLAATVVLLARVGALPGAKREARQLGVAGAVGGAVLAALAFTGPNSWWQYSDFGVAWSDTAVRPLGLPLDGPLPWLLLAAVIGLLGFGLVRMRALAGAWTLPASALFTLSALVMVVVLLGSFAQAPAQAGAFSVGRSSWDSVRARSCGIENEVETLPLAEDGALRLVDGPLDDTGAEAETGTAATADDEDGEPPATAFAANRERPGRPPQEPLLRREPGELALRPTGAEAEPTDASPLMWDSLRDGPATTGEVTTGWFELPALRPGQELSVWVAGRPEQGNELALQFGGRTGDEVRELGSRALRDTPPRQLPYEDPRKGRPVDWRDFGSWRLITVTAADLPARADRVRLHAVDTTTDEQGWLAFSGPAVRDVVPLRDVLDGGIPALVDWPISFLFPCYFDYPRVSHGTADSPGLLITPPAGEGSMAFDPSYGGVFTGVLGQSRRLETPSRLRGDPGFAWGHVLSVRYDLDRDAYDQRTRRVLQGGADGDGAYPFEEGDLHP